MHQEQVFTNIPEIETILAINPNQNKLKLDDILEAIKNLKTNFNIGEEIKIAIKILKRMKLNENCKWYIKIYIINIS
jgi:hypothetical protein